MSEADHVTPWTRLWAEPAPGWLLPATVTLLLLATGDGWAPLVWWCLGWDRWGP